MKNENNKNLRELLAQFVDAEEASKAAADIAAGDQIFYANPAPAPSPALINDIRRQMIIAASRKRRWTRHITRQIAAAAVIILIAGISMMILQRHSSQLARDSFWQETSESSISPQLTQLEQMEIDTPVITLEVNGNDMSAINDLMDELSEIEGTFWEG